MPNLLAHYGVQGPLSRRAPAGLDVKWVFTGCLLPDVPWIVQRAVRGLLPGLVSPYDLRLYVAVQASLFFCLLLGGALALLSERPRAIFGLLAVNAGLHLVVDGLQTKWGAGVHLAAPFSWQSWSANLFWPESAVTLVITAAGVVFVAWAVRRRRAVASVVLTVPSGGRALAAGVLAFAYLGLPPLFVEDAEAAGAHYVDVLRHPGERTGRYVELDRARWVDRPPGDVVRTFTGEEIGVRAVDLDRSGSASVRGAFVARDTLKVTGVHRHRSEVRDAASYVGLLVLLAAWWPEGRRVLRLARADFRGFPRP